MTNKQFKNTKGKKKTIKQNSVEMSRPKRPPKAETLNNFRPTNRNKRDK